MDDGITIRFATLADVPQLAEFRLALRSQPGVNIESEETFRKRCELWMSEALKLPEWRCWVAAKGAVLEGGLWLQLIEKIPNPTPEAERLAYITNFFVNESLRGRGLGSRILDEALDFCRRENVHSVVLWPTERSRPLYQRYGFNVPQGLFELKLLSSE